MNRCALCNAEYKPWHKTSKYCSRKCMIEYLRPLRVAAPQFQGRRGINPPRKENRAGWKGDAATENTKRHRARLYHPLREFCDRCLTAKAKDRHHIDGNPGNNAESNIAHLCRRCHMLIDGRLGMRKGMTKERAASL